MFFTILYESVPPNSVFTPKLFIAYKFKADSMQKCPRWRMVFILTPSVITRRANRSKRFGYFNV